MGSGLGHRITEEGGAGSPRHKHSNTFDSSGRAGNPHQSSRLIIGDEPAVRHLQELNDAHLRIVAAPEAVAEHARVPAVAVRVALGNLLKERVHKLLVVNVAERLTAGGPEASGCLR